EVAEIGGGFGVLGGLDHLRNLDEPGIVQEPTERGEAEEAVTDMLVTIEAGAQAGTRVVEMEGEDSSESDVGGDLVDDAVPRALAADVITRGEEMAGVDADAEPLGTRGPAEQLTELGQPVADP